MTIASRCNSIRAGVLEALQLAKVPGLAILTAGIEDFRPLTWYAPGIYPHTEVGNSMPTVMVGFGDIRWTHLRYSPQEVFSVTLQRLAEEPLAVISEDGSFLTLPSAAFGLLDQEARVVFTGPALDVNGKATSEAAYVYALEFVAVCALAGLGTVYRDDSTFLVDNPEIGLHAGIKEGRIVGCGDYWNEVDISGYVGPFLTMTRGAGWTTHTLDPIDRLMFWHESQIEPLEGLESLAEALAVLKACIDKDGLLKLERQLFESDPNAVQKATHRAQRLTPAEYFARLDEASALMLDWQVTDQTRIMRLFELLVPHILTESSFNRTVYDMHKPVATLSQKAIQRALLVLEKLRNKPKVLNVKPNKA